MIKPHVNIDIDTHTNMFNNISNKGRLRRLRRPALAGLPPLRGARRAPAEGLAMNT